MRLVMMLPGSSGERSVTTSPTCQARVAAEPPLKVMLTGWRSRRTMSRVEPELSGLNVGCKKEAVSGLLTLAVGVA